MTKDEGHSTVQDFLDQQQYSKHGVLKYEKIFGPGFVSTGGLDTTKVCLVISSDKIFSSSTFNPKSLGIPRITQSEKGSTRFGCRLWYWRR